jgi:hypothetical protein
MITVEQYREALKIVRQFNKQRVKIPPYAVKSCLYPFYYVSKRGEVWREDGIKKIIQTRISPKTGRKQLRVSINNNSIGLATIIATQFVPQPNGCNRVYFKDNDPTNCNADNLCWLNEKMFSLATVIKTPHSPLGKVKNTKKYGEAKVSATTVKCEFLKKYYLSGNEKYLQQCWDNIDAQMTMQGWNEVKSECYIYFMDRCKRKSLTGNPVAYIIIMAQRIYKGSFKTLNTSKASESIKLDASLITQNYD